MLASRDHHEYLLAAIPGAQRKELGGGHVLADQDLAAVYGWLASTRR